MEPHPIRMVVEDDLRALAADGLLPAPARHPAPHLAHALEHRRVLRRADRAGSSSLFTARLPRAAAGTSPRPTSATRPMSTATSCSRRTRSRGSPARPAAIRSTSRSTAPAARPAGRRLPARPGAPRPLLAAGPPRRTPRPSTAYDGADGRGVLLLRRLGRLGCRSASSPGSPAWRCGRMPNGFRDVLAYALRYGARPTATCSSSPTGTRTPTRANRRPLSRLRDR